MDSGLLVATPQFLKLGFVFLGKWECNNDDETQKLSWQCSALFTASHPTSPKYLGPQIRFQPRTSRALMGRLLSDDRIVQGLVYVFSYEREISLFVPLSIRSAARYFSDYMH